jgi:predicted DNA binding CopG/RHH family protein
MNNATLTAPKNALLDADEQEVVDAFESGTIVAKRASKTQREQAKTIANQTLKREERINIRLSRADLSGLKDKANELGMPYQTLVSAVLHQYVTGRLATNSSAGIL